jgi:hypothetical protein
MAALIRLEWALRLGLRRLGWQRVLAGLMLALALGLFLHTQFVVLPSAAALAAEAATTPRLPRTTAIHYPPLSQMAGLPGWLQSHASNAGLTLNQAQFDLENSGAVSRYRATLPLTGSYLALRQFLADALNHYPNLALESVQMKRDKSTEETLNVRLVLVFYLAGRNQARAVPTPP